MKGTGLLEGMTILGMGQEIYKMSLGYLVVPESKEVLNFFFLSDGNIPKGLMERNSQ